MLMGDLLRIDYHRKTLAELFELYLTNATGDEPQREALDNLEALLRWKIADRVSGVSSPIVEVTPPLPDGAKLVLIDDTIAVFHPDGSTRPGSKVWLHRPKVMWDGQLRRLDYSPEEGLKIGGWRRTPEPLSLNDFIAPLPPPKEIINDNEPIGVTNDNESSETDAPKHAGGVGSSYDQEGASLRWPRPDELTAKQRIAFKIMQDDGRFSKCRDAEEMLEVMSIAKIERLLFTPRWPKSSNGQLEEGGPLQRDALYDALQKHFPVDP